MKVAILLVIFSILSCGVSYANCPELSLKNSGQSTQKMELELRETVNAYLKAFDISGAVVLVGHGHGVSYHEAFGTMDGKRPLLKDALYDLASITKLFTATALLKALEEQGLDHHSKVFETLGVYERRSTMGLSFESLLRHESGLRPIPGPLVYDGSVESAWDYILSIDPQNPRGKFKYSDVNYLVLGKALESLVSLPLDKALRRYVLDPLGMEKSGFLPLNNRLNCEEVCVPTMRNEKIGAVHDPVSRRLGGVAGHAGMFATALELSRFASMFLNEGHFCGRAVVSRKQVREMTNKKAGSSRGLGFDITSPYSVKPRGDYFANGLSFGHTGYTGVSLWIDPTLDTYLIVLSNPVYSNNWMKAKKGLLKMVKDLASLVGRSYSL